MIGGLLQEKSHRDEIHIPEWCSFSSLRSVIHSDHRKPSLWAKGASLSMVSGPKKLCNSIK